MVTNSTGQLRMLTQEVWWQFPPNDLAGGNIGGFTAEESPDLLSSGGTSGRSLLSSKLKFPDPQNGFKYQYPSCKASAVTHEAGDAKC